MTRRYWTIKDLNYLKANLHLTDNQLAVALNRDKQSIGNARWRYGLKKQENRGCFKQGFTPWNKGKEYNAGGRSVQTRFKTGHKKPNERPLYTVFGQRDAKRMYLFIKLPHCRNYPYGRYVWEQKTGRRLKPGEVISFRDGNQLNCDFKNLIKVTKAEMAAKNIDREKGADSLRKVWAVVKTFEDFGLTPPYKFRSKRKSA